MLRFVRISRRKRKAGFLSLPKLDLSLHEIMQELDPGWASRNADTQQQGATK